jgi:hypothetical protein
MDNVDKRGRLEEATFSYREGKDGKVFVSWMGRQVQTLKGDAAARFLERVARLDGREAQLLMAKATGNFKRGNERLAKQSRR